MVTYLRYSQVLEDVLAAIIVKCVVKDAAIYRLKHRYCTWIEVTAGTSGIRWYIRYLDGGDIIYSLFKCFILIC